MNLSIVDNNIQIESKYGYVFKSVFYSLVNKYKIVWNHLLTFDWLFLFREEKYIPYSVKTTLQQRAGSLLQLIKNMQKYSAITEYTDRYILNCLQASLELISPVQYQHLKNISIGKFPLNLQEINDNEWRPINLPTDEALEIKRNIEDLTYGCTCTK